MESCCPDKGHAATDHGTMVISSDSGLVSDCDPVTTDGQSLGSTPQPDPIVVGVDLVSGPTAVTISAAPFGTVARSLNHGPPVYLRTLRVRL